MTKHLKSIIKPHKIINGNLLLILSKGNIEYLHLPFPLSLSVLSLLLSKETLFSDVLSPYLSWMLAVFHIFYSADRGAK